MALITDNPVQARHREATLDTVRGIAIILLVFYHVIGYGTSGLRLEEDHPLRQLNTMLIYIRMPLFTILSGYVYAMRPFAGDGVGFVKGKAARLLVPLVVVGTIFALVQTWIPGANAGLDGDEWWTIHIQPVAHFWFLEALFWVFLVIMLLERAGRLATLARTTAVFLVAGVASAAYEPPVTLGFRGALYLLPFFLFGLGLKRFAMGTPRRTALLISVPVMILSLGFCVAGVLDIVDSHSRTSLFALVAGCSSGFVLIRSGVSNVQLAGIGLFSYTIFLFHTFATAASRIGLERLGLDVLALQVAAGVTVGILVPIGIDLAARRNMITRRALLGRSRPDLS